VAPDAVRAFVKKKGALLSPLSQKEALKAIEAGRAQPV
jgi:hypothetical protein